jgi:hypothetical protein
MSRSRVLRFAPPPRALRHRGVLLDNVALVPGNLLPFKREWQAMANRLPQGSVLVCLPAQLAHRRPQLTRVTAELRAKGHQVTTVPAERFGAVGGA